MSISYPSADAGSVNHNEALVLKNPLQGSRRPERLSPAMNPTGVHQWAGQKLLETSPEGVITSSEQQHTNQQGQHDQEPIATAQVALFPVGQQGPLVQHYAQGYSVSYSYPSADAGSVNHMEALVLKNSLQGSRRPERLSPAMNPTGVHQWAGQKLLETSPEGVLRQHRGGSTLLSHTAT